MTDSLPPEIAAHRNRISPELADFIIKALQGEFSSEASKQIGRILWNVIDDPVYEKDEELRYLASKIGVITGQYDLAIKAITDDIIGTKVWGSVALFEIGEVDEAISTLQQIIEKETSDFMPLVEAIFWLVYLKQLIGDSENIDGYKTILEDIFDPRNTRRIHQQVQDIKDFTVGLIDLQSVSNIAGIKKIEEFIHKRENAGDQFWQLIGLLILGEQQLDSSDYIASNKIYVQARVLAENVSNVPLIGAVDIGLAHVHFLKGELKAGNILSAQTNDKLQGISQYYLAKGHFVRGQIMIKLGHHKMARDSLNIAYSLANQYHDYNKSFITLLAIAESYAITNEKDKAQEIFDKAYNQVVNIGNKRQFAQALVQIATSDYRQGKFDSASKRADQIETLSEEIQYQKGKTDALRLRSQINITRNNEVDRNIFTLLACQILYLEVGDEDSSANCDILIAEGYTKLGNSRKAAIHLNNAKNFFLRISDSMKIAEIKELQASFDINDGKFDEALVKLRSSYSHYSDVFDRNKRVGCLRKIADILALKGDFRESLARYTKVQGLISENNDMVDNVVLQLNKARISQYASKTDIAKESYKFVERYLRENKLKNLLGQILVEKTLMYILEDNEELATEIMSQIQELANEGYDDFKYWYCYLEALRDIKTGEYVKAYSDLTSILQQTLEKKNIISIGILFNLIRLVIEINAENLADLFVYQEVNNYIVLLKGIVTEGNFYYLRGITFLVDLLWQFMSKIESDYNEIVVQASEYFASTGIEEFGNLLLTLQYNIGDWEGQTESRIRTILGAPKSYETPKIALLEILEKSNKSLFIEEILRTENRFLKEIKSMKEAKDKK
ncbi:MAG: hypothetical protein H7644_04175 [Candidatus Heimdallarchaeota archaeon]|nr:hypothetical protein [Candidatus Heimdallarchaeota archaeon]MCK5142941.1 hypothetical protein [Candidatus Heimdallarchaeota archaeon]